MLHAIRIIFICLLVAISAYALTQYAAPRLAQHNAKRLMPMPEKGAPAGEASENAPTLQPLPPPIMPGGEGPLFTVDVEGIPPGFTARGTSFPLGNGLWLTARHFANEECAQIIMIIDGKNVPAHIKFLDPNADLAVLQTATQPGPSLPIDKAPDVADDQTAYAFGFPSGSLGATEGRAIGHARMKLGGRLDGTAPVVTWAEIRRFPDSLDSLSGISGGPMIDEAGNVVGIIVSASVRRGRNYTVAPEILHAVQSELGLAGPVPNQQPAKDVVTQPVSLEDSVTAMSKNARIALTYCIPQGS